MFVVQGTQRFQSGYRFGGLTILPYRVLTVVGVVLADGGLALVDVVSIVDLLKVGILLLN